MSNKFQYQSRQPNAWQSRAEQTGGGFIGFLKDAVTTYSVKKQENWIRILPPTWPDAKHYGFDVWVHYGVGPQNATVLCNLKLYNTPCCVCEAYTRADAEGRDDAYDYKAGRRVLVWLIDRKDEKLPLAWAMPWTLDRDISKLCKDRQTGELYQIDHPEVGYDISFDREGDVPNVKYVGIQVARRPSPVADAHLDFILERPLPSLLIKRTYEEVKALFEGGGPAKAPEPAQQQAPTQPVQQAPAPAQTQQTPPWAQAPQQQAPPPPPPVQQPVQQAPQVAFCANAVTFQGNSIGCTQVAGHPGPCTFERIIGPAAPVQAAPFVPPAPIPTQQFVLQQPVPQAPPAAPQPPAAGTLPGGSRAAALRERFAQR